LLGLLQVFGSNVLPLSKQDKIDGSVSARVKLVYFELLCAPIGQEHREHVAIMCWNPTRTKFDEILVGGDPVRESRAFHRVGSVGGEMWFIGGGGDEIPDFRAGLRGCWFVVIAEQSSSLRNADTGSSGADEC